MRIAGLPVWTLVLVACAVAPFLIQLWIDAEQRRAKERTRALLRPFLATIEGEGAIASGTGRAASIDAEPPIDAQSLPRSSPDRDEPTHREDD
jgi:hypothetical protein